MTSSLESILQDRSVTLHNYQHAADTKILHQPDALTVQFQSIKDAHETAIYH
jgi:hypothetical protein